MEKEKKIAELLPIPEGFEDPQEFLDTFEERKRQLEEAKEGFNRLLVAKASLEGRAPELEPADATEQLEEAQAAFDRALRHGQAIDRIREDFENLRTEMDEGTLEPWLEHVAEVVAPLSGQRYRAMDLEDRTFTHGESGLDVPFQALSQGTRATLALALRLSMARWFLADQQGFLLLDDPLVDLDPQRQKEAAAMLRAFAQDKQVILMTCHPSHAEILGGEVMEL
jgi:exonuclease SbcC